MNIFCNTITEITTTIANNITTITTNNNNNVSVLSAVLSASLSLRCCISLFCNGGDGFQVWKLASNILNKQQQTSDKGCLPVWWLGEFQTTQYHNSLLHYEIFHKASDWDCSLERCEGNWKWDLEIGRYKEGMGVGHRYY